MSTQLIDADKSPPPWYLRWKYKATTMDAMMASRLQSQQDDVWREVLDKDKAMGIPLKASHASVCTATAHVVDRGRDLGT